jgi:hypothetical protein
MPRLNRLSRGILSPMSERWGYVPSSLARTRPPRMCHVHAHASQMEKTEHLPPAGAGVAAFTKIACLSIPVLIPKDSRNLKISSEPPVVNLPT